MNKIYFNRQDAGLRKVKDFVKENNLNFEFRSVTKVKPLTKEEFNEILVRTTEGVEEILATNSRIYKELSEEIQFSELKIHELYEIVVKYPTLLKSPIAILENGLYIGYNQDDIGILLNREERRKRFRLILQQAHAIELEDDMKQAS